MTPLDARIIELLINDGYTEIGGATLSPERMRRWEREEPIEAYAINMRLSALIGKCYLASSFNGVDNVYWVTKRGFDAAQKKLQLMREDEIGVLGAMLQNKPIGESDE